MHNVFYVNNCARAREAARQYRKRAPIVSMLSSVNHLWGIGAIIATVFRRTATSLFAHLTFGTPSGARTLDTLIKSQVLYQLS